MGILDPIDKNKLLAIEGLRKFVKDNEKKYVDKLKDWKSIILDDPDLANPHVLAAALKTHMMMHDSKLSSLMWSIWREDDTHAIEFYGIIAEYFVDREANG